MSVSEALAILKVAVQRAGIFYHEGAKARRWVEVFAERGLARDPIPSILQIL